jgi:hypothetical protein
MLGGDGAKKPGLSPVFITPFALIASHRQRNSSRKQEMKDDTSDRSTKPGLYQSLAAFVQSKSQHICRKAPSPSEIIEARCGVLV